MELTCQKNRKRLVLTIKYFIRIKMDIQCYLLAKPYQMALEMDLKLPATPTGFRFEKPQTHSIFEEV